MTTLIQNPCSTYGLFNNVFQPNRLYSGSMSGI